MNVQRCQTRLHLLLCRALAWLALATAIPGCVGTASAYYYYTANTNQVQFCVGDLTGIPLNRAITIVPSLNPLFATNHTIYAGIPVVVQPTNGCGTTNLIAGVYDLSFQGLDAVLTIWVTNSATLLQAADLVIVPTNMTVLDPGSNYAFPVSISDPRYQRQGTNQATATAGQVYAWDPVAGAGYFTDMTSGGGGISASTATNIVNANAVAKSSGASTNQFLTSTPQTGGIITIRPPLEYFGTGTVSALPGGIAWTISGGSHVFMPGEYVSINTNGATKQYMVSDYLDSTHFFTVEPAGESGSGNGYTNAPYKILPRSVVLPDENGSDGAVIANGSDYLVIGEGAFHNHNTGRLGWLNGTNSWFVTVANSVNRLDFFSQQNHGTPFVVYDIPDPNKFEALVVYSDAHVNARFGLGTGNGDTTPLSIWAPLSATKGGTFVGLTNTGHLTIGPDVSNTSLMMVGADGHATNVTLSGASLAGTTLTISGGGGGTVYASNIVAGGSPSFSQSANFKGMVNISASNSVNSAATMSGAYGSPVWTGSAGAFTGWIPGYRFTMTSDNGQYTVAQVVSPTLLYTVQPAQNTYASGAFSYVSPAQVVSNATPAASSYISADGSIGILSQSSGGTQLQMPYGSNSWALNIRADGNGNRMSWDSAYYQGVIQIFDGAHNDSLVLDQTGDLSIPGGVTNRTGANASLNLNAPVSAPRGISGNGLTNTGHFTVGPDVPNGSLMMVGSDGHATNVTLGTGLSFSGTTLNDSGGGGSDPTKAATNSPTIWTPRIIGGLNITNPATLSWINSTNDSTVWSNGPAGQTVIITNGSVTANGNGFIGSGATLSNLNASQVIAGTLPAAQLGNVFSGTNDFYGTNNFHSVVDFTGAFVYFGANLSIGNGDNVYLTNGQYFAVGTGGFTAGASGQFTGNAAGLTNYTPDANSPNMIRTLWHDGLVANAATETAISTNNLPANTLSANGQAIEYVLNGTNSAGSARTMAIYVYYGTGHDYVVQSTSTSAGAWEAHIRIVRVSASVVDVYTWGQIQGATSNINKYTDTGSTASAQPLSVTLQSTGGGTAGDISCRWGRAQFMP